MEAVAVVASFVGTSSFALELTKLLFEFGDAVTLLREETHKIARNISNYSNVLDLLQESLQAETPLYTQRAFELANSLSIQSQTILQEIKDLVPGSLSWAGSKFGNKTHRAFRETRVNALIGEVEHLKSTLNLLLQVVTMARQSFLAPDKGKHYQMRAEQALYEQYIASEQLATLHKEEQEEMEYEMQRSSSRTNTGGALVSYNDPILSAFQDKYMTSNAPPHDKAVQLRADSSTWLNQMRVEWFDSESSSRDHGNDKYKTRADQKNKMTELLQEYVNRFAMLDGEYRRIHSMLQQNHQDYLKAEGAGFQADLGWGEQGYDGWRERIVTAHQRERLAMKDEFRGLTIELEGSIRKLNRTTKDQEEMLKWMEECMKCYEAQRHELKKAKLKNWV